MQFTTVSGSPIPHSRIRVGRKPVILDIRAKGVNFRNTGINTLFVSVGGFGVWWELACGTSLDALVAIEKVELRTVVGETMADVLLST